MGGLSGCAQRVLFNMLEEVALEGNEILNIKRITFSYIFLTRVLI